MFSLASPIFLLVFLLSIPLFLLIQRWRKTQSQSEKRNPLLLLRFASLACLFLALAGVHRKTQSSQLTVAFLIDISKSIPEVQKHFAINQINTIINSLEPMDQYCVISFAIEAARFSITESDASSRIGPGWVTKALRAMDAGDSENGIFSGS